MSGKETGLTMIELAKCLLNGKNLVYYELYNGDQYSFDDLALEELTSEDQFENGFAHELYFDTNDNLLESQNSWLQANEIDPQTFLVSLYIDGTIANRELITCESNEKENLPELLKDSSTAVVLKKHGIEPNQLSWKGTVAHSSRAAKYHDTLVIVSGEIVYGNHQAGIACIADSREDANRTLKDLMRERDVKLKSTNRRKIRFFQNKDYQSWHSSKEYREATFVCLKELAKGYSTGDFETVFPHLDDACVFTSQWVFSSLNGKDAVVEYLRGKGETLRNHHACPNAIIAEESFGNLCLSMTQGNNNDSVVVLIELNKEHLITQINLCQRGFYDLRKYEGETTEE